MAISKIVLNSTTQIDLTQDTVSDASHIRNGYVGHLNDGTQVTGNYSGGASNIVTGTFTGTTTGSTLDVTVPYSGSGYPVAIIVAPTGGIYGNSTYSAAVARYAIGFEAAYKTYVTSTPTYSSSGDENMYSVTTLYKNSTSSATSYTTSGAANIVVAYGSSASPSGATQSLLFRSNKSFGVRIYSSSNASNRGFLANVEYTYHVIYSS